MSLLASKTPIDIILYATTASDTPTRDNFIKIVKRLYQYEIFKPMLDLTASLATAGRLHFKVYDRKFFELDEGNCRTIANNMFDKLRNRFTTAKQYTITIKKTAPEVIVHEISHMLEQEGDLSPLANFAEIIQRDITNNASTNVSLQEAVRQVMIVEVGGYKSSHTNSELFARYFQLLAMAKEILGYDGKYRYTLQDLYRFFIHTSEWMWQKMYPQILPKINTEIALASQQYIKALEDIEHKWSESKIDSFHKKQSPAAGQPLQWRKSIKSIKNPLA